MGTIANAEVETADEKPEIESEGRTEKFVMEVADDLQDALVGTLATKIEIVGQTLKVHKESATEPKDMWDTYKNAHDEIHQWGYSLDSDATDDSVDVFRLVR